MPICGPGLVQCWLASSQLLLRLHPVSAIAKFMMGLAFLSSGLGPAQCLITVVSTQFLIRALPEVGSAPLTDELNSFLPYIRQTPRVMLCPLMGLDLPFSAMG